MKKLLLLAGACMFLTSCIDDDADGNVDDTPMESPLTSFDITIENVVNYLNVYIFNTPVGSTDPGPLTVPMSAYSVNFKAVPGSKLSFATMSVISNDHFFAPSGDGITLFENGNAVTGNITDQISLWDAGVEEEDPDTFTSAPGGAEAGDPDDDTSVRIVETDVTTSIAVSLMYDETTRYFTLTIENLQGSGATAPIVLAPGLIVLHAQDNPLFTEGEPDRDYGLAPIAVVGNPSDLYGWFTETGSDGDPLRLSSSFTVLAPGITYAFDSLYDPVLAEGQAVNTESGVEQNAEDGNAQALFGYITGELSLPAALSNETAPIGPGGSLTFTLMDVPRGHKLGFSTMFVFSNDWFISSDDLGLELFNDDGNGSVISEHDEINAYLFDAGTEEDQEIGFGDDQAPFQSSPNTGASDDNDEVRKVIQINDVQYGKGAINSSSAVADHGNPKGGYNLVKVTVAPK